MNADLPSNPQNSRIPPLIAAAAVAVILVSGTGIAAMAGWLPTSHAVSAPQAASAMQSAQIASAPVAAAPAYNAAHPEIGEAAREAREHHHVARATPAQASGYRESGSHDENPGVYGSPAAHTSAYDPNAGEVVAINAVQSPEPATGVGAVGGALAGGLLGNQFGRGRGRTLATIAGAVGGGLAGNGIEHEVRKATSYQVQVRMQDGSYRNFNYAAQPPFQPGEHVRVVGESLSAA